MISSLAISSRDALTAFDGLVAGSVTDAIDLANLPDHPAVANRTAGDAGDFGVGARH